MSALVSVIMPSYNTAEYIALSISSVIAQTYGDWELIIVDDCSTDSTDDVVRPFLSDPRIKYLKNGKNSGAAVSRNRALSLASGKWISFLDSDDIWLPEKLERQIAFMERNDYHFSYTRYSEIDSEGRPRGVEVSGPERITRRGFFNFCWPGCLTVMYDASYVGRINIVDIKKNNDYALWLKVSRRAECHLFDENLAFYRRGRRGSVSTHSALTMIVWHYRLFRISEKESIVHAFFNTVRNIVFGLYKKIRYVRHI